MNNKYILIVGIFILLTVGILGYTWNKKGVYTNRAVSPAISGVSPITFMPPTPTFTPPKEVWETYVNPELGFLIKYPEMVYGVYRCPPVKPFYVPVKVFGDNKNGIVYITEEYYYDNVGDNTQDNIVVCKKITHSLESITKERETVVAINDKVHTSANPFLTRVFYIKNIKNDTELNKFINNKYGPGCIVENKNPWKQEGVYEIVVRGEDWGKSDLGTTTCPLNFRYKLLYAPIKNKIMSVVLGQECGFGTSPASESYKCYDDEMIDSFRFK